MTDLNVRMRPDLVIYPQASGGRRRWVVKDPLRLKYFRLREEEFAILRRLDGRTGGRQIIEAFQADFLPRRLTAERLQAYVARLHEYGLVVADTPHQGEQLLLRRRRGRWRERLLSWSNLLAIRLPCIDPEPILRRAYPWCRWFFSAWCTTACVALIVAALALVISQFDRLQAKLPTFGDVVSAPNLAALALAMAMAKILHECAHLLACRHFRGECHEAGVLLLMFMPCLYCNVSDSWTLSNKWHRAAIAAAGMYVELILASVCVFLWWFSEPGLLNSLCFNLVLVCSLATVLVNGNPLLRFDGYYIMTDLLDVPNLWQRSRAVVRRMILQVCFGVRLAQDSAMPERHPMLLAAYAAASAAFRASAVIAILWLATKTLTHYRLDILALCLLAVTAANIVLVALWDWVQWLARPAVAMHMSRARAALVTLVVAMVVMGALLIPLPCQIDAPAVVDIQDASRVYVDVPGAIVESVRAGSKVRKGQLLARLANTEINSQVGQLEGQYQQQRLHLENLKLLRARTDIPAAAEVLADIAERLRQLRRDEERLTIAAPRNGTVLPAPARPAEPGITGTLPSWDGSPLDEVNMGSYLDAGTLLCLVGDPSRQEAVLAIPQHEIEFLHTGQRVKLQLVHLPGSVFWGTIEEIAKVEMGPAPPELASQGVIPTRRDAQGIARPLGTWYQVRVPIENPAGFMARVRGRAKIYADAQSLGFRLRRYLQRTFRFELSGV